MNIYRILALPRWCFSQSDIQTQPFNFWPGLKVRSEIKM